MNLIRFVGDNMEDMTKLIKTIEEHAEMKAKIKSEMQILKERKEHNKYH